VPENLAHLADAGIQPEAEEDFVVRGHDAVAPSRPMCRPQAVGLRARGAGVGRR
jgi:hypothetical protein